MKKNYLILLILLLTFPITLIGQDSIRLWKKYQVDSGIVRYEIGVYELKNGKSTKKPVEKIEVEMSFQNFGAITLIEWQTPGQEKQTLLKIDSLQYSFVNDSLTEIYKRKYDFDFEKIIMNDSYYCKQCIIVTAKPLNEKYLGYDCVTNLMVYSKDLPNRGSLTHYCGVPLKLKFVREQKGLVRIEALSFDLTTKDEIEKLKTIANNVYKK